MKIDMRRLTMTAVLLSASTAFPAVVQAQTGFGDGFDDYYGTEGGFVSDSFADEGAVQQTAATMYIGDDSGHSALQSSSDAYLQPSPAGSSAQVWDDHSAYATDSYLSPSPMSQYAGDYIDGSCDTSRVGAISRAACSNDPTVWLKAELLLWFPQGRQTPPLGVASEQPGLPTAINSDRIFNEPFGNDLTPGFRGDIGRYFAGGAFGIGGRVWVLGDDSDSLSFSGDGTGVSFAVPFFNTFTGSEDGVLVGFDDGQTQVAGDASVRTLLDIVAAEIYGRARLGQSRNHRLDFIGGYSHFNIADELQLSINRTQVPPGVESSFSDDFRTRNEFHGGQIGGEVSLKRGRWTASSLTKVHLGNMAQRVAVRGSSTQEVIGGGAPVVFDEGLFARGDVQGVRSRDVFAFAPEMNLKIGYQFREHVNFHVGYSFVYWSNVALAGEQMDRNLFLDPNDLGNTGTGRFVDINSSGFWVQGIDLGAVIEF